MNSAETPYDSTHTQQFRLLPVSHPDDWAAASDVVNPPAKKDGQTEAD
ncbi:hypothetical protein [Streptomyces rubrogriseus]